MPNGDSDTHGGSAPHGLDGTFDEKTTDPNLKGKPATTDKPIFKEPDFTLDGTAGKTEDVLSPSTENVLSPSAEEDDVLSPTER